MSNPTADVVTRLKDAAERGGGYTELAEDCIREIERLREVVTIPLLTPETTASALFLRVLTEHEKGQPVNAQDLINALMWRIRNQRKEIARLHERISGLQELVRT